jgi:hypothetical protein
MRLTKEAEKLEKEQLRREIEEAGEQVGPLFVFT